MPRLTLAAGAAILAVSGTSAAYAGVAQAEALIYWGTPPTQLVRQNLGLGGGGWVLNNDDTFGGVGSVNSLTVDSVSRRFFWFNGHSPSTLLTLWTARVDGTDARSLPVQATDGRLCVDSTRGLIYWHDDATDRIMRSDLEGLNPEVVFNGVPSIGAITIDTASDTLYWSLDGSGDYIQRGRTDGSARENFLQLGLNHEPISMTIDPTSRRLIYCDSFNRIRAVPIDASTGVSQTLFTSTGFPSSVAIDPGDGSLYWSEPGGGPMGSHLILRLAQGAQVPETIYQSSITIPWTIGLLLVPSPGASIVLGCFGLHCLRRARRAKS